MILSLLNIVAVSALSITGALAAGKHKMDLFGVMIIAFVTAMGGGTVRDVLLGNYPIAWIGDPYYLVMLCVLALIATAVPYFIRRFDKLFLLLDAVALVVFSMIGVEKALELNYGLIVCVVSGAVTGTFGGVLRDIFCNKIPLLFQREIYAGVSIVSGGLYYVLLEHTELQREVSVLVTLAVGFLLRVLAIYYKLGLPVFYFDEARLPSKGSKER